MATMQQRHAGWAKQHNDDLEDRAIGAAGNHGFTLGGRMKAEEVAELKAFFAADYRKIGNHRQEICLPARYDHSQEGGTGRPCSAQHRWESRR